MEGKKISIDIPRNGKSKVLDPLVSALLVQLPQKLQNCLKSQLKRLAIDGDRIKLVNTFLEKKNRLSAGLRINLEKQLQAWRENPSWVSPPSEIEVSVAKGSLCHLKATVDVGLPPDAVYNIVTDPDNRRVFKNVKEVISRKVLIDEGQRQVVEVEQSAVWRFLLWSGTISVHVLVDQNREDHSMRFKQMSNGFMKIFEGYWRVEPLFIDEESCFPFKPKTWAEYCSCTGGKGRIGSKVSLDQLIQPAIAPPPPISWYLSGIPAKTTEMLINDLIAEADRIKGSHDSEILDKELLLSKKINEHCDQLEQVCDIKERWKSGRRNRKLLRRRKKMLAELKKPDSKSPAQPNMTADTTTLGYWLNWRFALCALLVLVSMVVAAVIIWKLEGRKRWEHRRRQNLKEPTGLLYEDETWNTCLEAIHPAWLLGFRVFAFFMLLLLLIASVVTDGGAIFYFYTQWTFTLVTIYFGFGSAISIYGCRKHCRKTDGYRANHVSLDSEQGTYVPPTIGEIADGSSNHSKHYDPHEATYHPPIAGPWRYAFQIVYQICAGAVMLTDTVFWLILYPFLTPKGQGLNFMIVSMHSINAVFLIGDTILNCMRFPLFRIAYFILWTGAFVVFQWIIHACVDLWWPYPFLDLSSPYAPLWYLGVGVMHIPCYGTFALVVKLKDFCFSRSFPDLYRKLR
ncbi:hypothetical protein V6N13_012801 [Hibiscus sabdariffa]|uniref:DUF220 domain-containing protein n=1 Tax=Hibiscus sabdariffa TaxID=183260 RepID=A0ABR2SGA2_9ROSI